MLVRALALSSMAVGGLAVPTFKNVQHESRPQTGHLLSRSTKVEATGILPIRIALKQNNIDNADSYLMAVADPTSDSYGQHWTEDQVHAAFAPSDDAIKAVQDWLVSSGISSDRIDHYDSKGWLGIQMTTAEAEKIFNTKYYEYNDDHGFVRIGNDGYQLPDTITQYVDYVTPGVQPSAPLTKRTLTKTKRSEGAVLPAPDGIATTIAKALPLSYCDQFVDPKCMRALYNLPANAKFATGQSGVGVYELGSEMFAQEDLDGYHTTLLTGVPRGTKPIVDSIAGGQAPTTQSNAGFESDADIEILQAIAYPNQVTLYQTGTDDGDFLNNWLEALDGSFCTGQDRHDGDVQCGTFKPENVVSISWSTLEAAQTPLYQHRACLEFLKLGLQGHTMVFSSGDHGVGGRNGCLGDNADVFNPPFPSNCPYVLSVGATQVDAGKTPNDPEVAMFQPSSNFSSAGGFANLFPTAAYQFEAVEHYFRKHDPGYPSYNSLLQQDRVGIDGGVFNRHGRGYPDVSSNGANIGFFWQGEIARVVGTSFSTPTWAAILTLINEERAKLRKRPVGFVNPALYRNTQAFNDITSGTGNANCNSNGFSPVEGWDPVTGLGTPNYPELLKALVSLP